MERNQHIQIHRSAIDDPKPLPLSTDALAEMVQAARANRGTVSGELARHDVRLDIEPMPVVMSVIHPGGTHTSAECVAYDLGPGGVGLLYPGYLYANAECMVRITTTSNEPAMLEGAIAWCRFLTRGIHCVGVHWRNRLDVRRFVPSTMWSELASVNDEHLKAEIRGRLLCIGAAGLEVELLRVILRDMPVTIEAVDSGGAAIDALHQQSFDLLIIDDENTEIESQDVLQRMRAEGFAEPALVLAEKKHVVGSSPQDGVRWVSKPLESGEVIGTVREIMLAHNNPMNGSAPITSTLIEDPKMAGAIRHFVEQAKRHADTIRGGIHADNFEEVRRLVSLLHNTGAGFGFAVLSQAATEALRALDASGSAQEAAPALKLLNRVIERLEAVGRPTQRPESRPVAPAGSGSAS